MHRLITIRISHYNERARWALDRCRVPYREEPYMPMLHMLPVLVATRGGSRGDRISTRLSTPVLITEGGHVIGDSSEIIEFASQRRPKGMSSLRPGEGEGELERAFHDTLGPHARRLAYHELFSTPELLGSAARRNVSPLQAQLFAAAQPAIAATITRALGVDARRAERSRERVRQVFDDVSHLLEGQRYLVGDRFTAADLSFASLATPAFLPTPEEGFGGGELPRLDEVSSSWRELAQELRATRAGQHALRMFCEHR